jgi:glutathione S-transferase
LLKLIIGNRAYSSWSMRGWLALRQSGEEFEEFVVPMFDADWEKRREGDEFAPSLGKVPILWDGECVVWDSLAIIEFLADRVGREVFWPEEDSARGMARSMAAEMHSGFAHLRRELPMNVRKSYPPKELSDEVREEIDRILELWAQARARFGGTGEFLFGDYCATDIMYAPVVTRFITYGVPVPPFAALYMKSVLSHPHVSDWIDQAQDEPWVIEAYEAEDAAA